jgi:hypothetical protein
MAFQLSDLDLNGFLFFVTLPFSLTRTFRLQIWAILTFDIFLSLNGEFTKDHQCVFILHTNIFLATYSLFIIWDGVPTMVEIAIFWFQIHITNGLNLMHRKWHTGNQYMVKSAENQMRSNLEPLSVINVESRPRYISAQKISTLFWCTEWAWNWQIIFRFATIHGRACFNRWKEHPYIVLQYTPKSTQK